MVNCLVTKLNGSVNNMNLYKINEFFIDIKPYSGAFDSSKLITVRVSSIIESVEDRTIRTSGDFVDENGNSLGSTVLLPEYNTYATYNIRVSQAGGRVFFPYKYKSMNRLHIMTSIENISLSDLKYCEFNYLYINSAIGKLEDAPYAIELYINCTNVEGGTLSDVFKKDNWIKSISYRTHISLTNLKNMNGQLSDFAKFTSLTELTITDSPISGTLEDYVFARRNLGQSTGTISLPWIGSNKNITFNGNTITSASNIKSLSWTSNTITFNGVTIDA